MSETYQTINQLFADAVKTYPDSPALSERTKSGWDTLTYRELDDLIRRFSYGLRALGIDKGDRVALLAENSSRWAVVDLAVVALGGITVSIYPTLPAAQVAHILKDSGAKAIVAGDARQIAKAEEILDECPDLTFVIALEKVPKAKETVSLWEDILKEGDKAAENIQDYEERRSAATPDDVMALIYTSGTTGSPKGAMLTQGNLGAGVSNAKTAFPFTPPGEVFLSFLPMCHVFERVTYYLALAMGSHTYFNDSIFKLMDNLADVKPTIMQCVPRIFETFHERVLDTVAKKSEREQKIFHWAVSIGARVANRKNQGKWVRPTLWLRSIIADKLVLAKVRQRFGGRLKFFVSGGAPLSAATADFFHALGIPILEGWGLTETTAAASANPYGRARIGTVGTARFGSTVSLAKDGEILVKGPTVMKGYWNNPTATADAIDSDGWFHTGDIGEIDKHGYIKITDRKKDIIVLANGKNVAPQPIENRLRESSYIAEVVLLGDNSGGISALIVPNYDKVKHWLKDNGKDATPQYNSDPDLKKLFKKEIDASAGALADFEKVKRFALLDHPLSIEAGELTPTLKVKRKVVAERYGNLLERDQSAQ